MNRPNLEDYKFKNGLKFRPYTEYRIAQYATDLEKYCDELEHEKGMETLRCEAWEEECEKYKKALKKACDRLAKYDRIIYGDDEPVTAQDYYDWSFEDD